MEIKKIEIWSFVKIAVLFGLIFGLIAGIISSIYLSIMADKITSQSGNEEISAAMQQMYGFTPEQMATSLKTSAKTAWLISTIMAAISAFILGLLASIIYNLLARYLGGIKLEFAEKKK